MKRLSSSITSYLSTISGDDDAARIQWRAAKVRSMWAACVEDIFLEHTNSVYIINEEKAKILIVYVDESIFAAELNARRELIKLKFLQEFGEDIDEFRILISRGSYKKNYPFVEGLAASLNEKSRVRKLTGEEEKHIDEVVAVIEDETLRGKLKQAMIADFSHEKKIPPPELK